MIPIELYSEDVEETIQFPDCWNELNYAELLLIIGHLLYGESGKQELLFKLLQGRTALDLSNLNPDTFFMNEESLGAFLDINNLTRFVQPKRTKSYLQILGTVSQELKVYPEDDFGDLTVGEFESCMSNLLDYQACQTTQERVACAKLLCEVLFAATNAQGKRIQEPELTAAQKANTKLVVLALPEKYLHIVVMWFIGCASMLPQYFPLTYSGGDADAADAPKEPDHMAVTKMIHAAARDKEPNARQLIRALPLKEFLFDCEQLLLQNPDVYDK